MSVRERRFDPMMTAAVVGATLIGAQYIAGKAARDAMFLAQRAEMSIETRKSSGRARPAELQVERADGFEPGQPLFALSTDQGMLEQGQQRHRRKLLGGNAGDAEQQGPGRRLGQRPSGTVIRLDAPAGQQCRNAAGELPVRRH